MLFSFLFVSMPDIVHAEESNVLDWIEEEESNQQPAEDSKSDVASNPPEEKSFAAIIGQLFLYTLLIVVLIYGLIKFLALRQKSLQPNQAVQLLGGTPLGNNKSLQIVKIGGKMYLLGVADSINLIKEFSSEEEMKQIEKDLDQQLPKLSKSMFDFTKWKSLLPTNKTQSNGAFQQLFNQSLNKQRMKQEQLQSDLNKTNENREGNPK